MSLQRSVVTQWRLAVAVAGALVLVSATPGAAQQTSDEIVTVRKAVEIDSKQRLPYFVGISANTAGAKGISMNLVIIPPGGAAKAHSHRDYESAIYLMKGRVETRYGPALAKSVVNRAGDFIYIPPDVLHQPRNLSSTEPAVAIVARNDPNEQENVVPHDIEIQEGLDDE